VTIKYLHIRRCAEDGTIEPIGGVTIAYTILFGTDIALHIARCRVPTITECGNVDPGDLFCYKKGRSIAASRLRGDEPYDVISLKHPITPNIVQWFADNYFEPDKIEVKQDMKKRWISTFEPI
jgi:hypothetical protein